MNNFRIFRRIIKSNFSFINMSSSSTSNNGDGSSRTAQDFATIAAHAGRSTAPETLALMAMFQEGVSPRLILNHLAPSHGFPPDTDNLTLFRCLLSLMDPPQRKKLAHYNTIDDAVSLINNSKKIVVLSGAGISTSAGLPDFRSRNGIYVQIHAEHPDLVDPKDMFDIHYFRRNPRPFYQFAKALFPGQYQPTIGHKFIKCIEKHDKLLRNYTQNIDTLENQAGIQRVVECHGSFSKATCTNCKYSVDGDSIKDDIFEQKMPKCPKCNAAKGENGRDGKNRGPTDGLGLMKPNIVFFGEQLSNDFHNSLDEDKSEVDLLIVIGSSLKVRPVALIPRSIPADVPQILINKESLDHMVFDIELLGNCDDIIQELCLRLSDSWTEICQPTTAPLKEIVDISIITKKTDTTLDVTGSTIVDEGKVAAQTKGTSTAPAIENDTVSMSSVQDDELNSLKSNGATVASESSIEQNMIEEDESVKKEEEEENKSVKKEENSAISDSDDSDWVDIDDSSDSMFAARDMADMEIPGNSYVYIKPNKYLFRGAELTSAQFEKYTKESMSESDKSENHRNLKSKATK